MNQGMDKDLTVEQSFHKFLTNLNPTDKQRERIQKSRDSIDSLLLNDPKIHLNTRKQISFLTGSYSRNTIIRPIDDIDLYVRIHYRKHAEDQSPMSVLRLMAQAIRRRYSGNSKVDVDAPCIVVQFWGYKFEVVPAYGHEEDSDLYSVPAPGSKEWMQCYPNVPNKWLSSCNHINDSYFIPIIKMLKHWNRYNKVGLKSFHIELLTSRVFTEQTNIYSYPQGILDWMYCVKSWLDEKDHPFMLEPGKSYAFVDDYLYEKPFRIRVARNRLEKGLKKAQTAWNLYQKGKFKSAKNIWHHMFGSKFPSPSPTVIPGYQQEPGLAPTLVPGPQIEPPFLGRLDDSYRSMLMDALSGRQPKPPVDRGTLFKALLGYKDYTKK